MKKITLLTFVFIVVSTIRVLAQKAYSEDTFRVFDGNGNPATIEQVIMALHDKDVVFLGEEHNDEIAHAIEADIFRRAILEYSTKRKVALSLEMFESDEQIVLDEYLAGLISEDHFLLSSRPWPNYKTDYRPLVELAKENKLTVIAANAPRRYVNMVSRNGRSSLDGLSKQAKAWLAPLPYGQPSPEYAAKFRALMAGAPEAAQSIDNILASQSLWDATMGNSVARYLSKNKGSLVVHVNGAFHTESRLGTVEQLLKYRPKTRALVVTMRPASDFKTFDKSKYTGLGDFVILTRPKPTPVIREIMRRMDDRQRSLQSLATELTLTRHDAQLNMSDTYTGNATYLAASASHPLYLRVDWTKPAVEQLVVIGQKYELYRPRLNQVIYGEVTGEAVQNPLSFVKMTREQLNRNFNVTYIGQEEITSHVMTWHLQLTPTVATFYRDADIWVDADGRPIQVRVNQKNRDTDTLLLSNIQENVKIDARVFSLKYPSSVKRIKG